MLASAVLIAVTLQERTVTFTHRCANSSIVLEALGKEIGMTLRPKGTVLKDFLFIRFKDLPIETALDKLADSINATWEGENGVRYLDRTREDHIEEMKPVWPLVDRFIAKNDGPFPTVEELVPLFAKLGMADKGSERFFDVYRQLNAISPPNRAMAAMVRTLDRDDLAIWSLDGTIEFNALDPESRRPFTPPMKRAIERMMQELAIVRESVQRAGISDDANVPFYVRTLRQGLSPDDFVFRIEIKPTSMRCALDPKDSKSELVGGQGLEYDNYVDVQPRHLLEGLDVPFSHLAGDLQFFDKLALTLEEHSPTFGELPTRIADALRDLPMNDPLSMCQSEVLLKFSEMKDLNVVAVLEDYYLIPYGKHPRPKSLREAMETIFGRHKVALDQAHNLVSIVPFDEQYARSQRWDRNVISQIVNQSAKSGWFDIEACAKLLGNRKMFDNQDYLLQNLFTDRDMHIPDLFVTTSWLHLYGALSDPIKRAARTSPVEIKLGALTYDARKSALSLLGWKKLEDPTRKRKEVKDMFLTSEYVGDVPVPRAYLSSARFDSVTLRLTHTKQMRYVAKPAKSGFTTVGLGIMNADELAYWISIYDKNSASPDPTHVAVVPSEVVLISLSVPEGEMACQLTSSGLPITKGFVPLDHLPPQQKVEIQRALARIGKTALPTPRTTASDRAIVADPLPVGVGAAPAASSPASRSTCGPCARASPRSP
ncbi:MAG: hypothetical protein WD716_03545 [Fimbriimonadaceae bacterium]